MKACWLKMPVPTLGQLLKLTVIVDGVFFTSGFAVAIRRMQNVVFGFTDTDRRWSGTTIPWTSNETGQQVDDKFSVPVLPVSIQKRLSVI